MRLPRTAERCIACLREPPFPPGEGFTEEHVIPRALGGVLTCDFLCKLCNSRFGHTFEADVKKDPAIRLAVHALKDKLPALYASMEEGQPYRVESGGKRLPAVLRAGEVVGQTRRVDGDLWVAPHEAEGAIRTKLLKSGMSPDDVDKALRRYASAPEDTEIELGNGLVAVSRPAFSPGPDVSGGNSLAPLAALKIAYEFAVLSFGPPLLGDDPPLKEIRRALLEADANSPVFRVDSLMAKDRKYEPFHGIAFEGNDPHATIQVRLFGYLAYRVHLPNLSFDAAPFGYQHRLDTGEESVELRE